MRSRDIGRVCGFPYPSMEVPRGDLGIFEKRAEWVGRGEMGGFGVYLYDFEGGGVAISGVLGSVGRLQNANHLVERTGRCFIVVIIFEFT